MIKYIRDLFDIAPYTDDGFIIMCVIFFIIISLMILYLIYVALDDKLGSWEDYTGTIVDKQYVGATTSSGSITTVNSSGGIGVGRTSNNSPEEFLLFAVVNVNVFKVDSSMNEYYSYKVGDKLQFSIKYGKWSKKIKNSKVK